VGAPGFQIRGEGDPAYRHLIKEKKSVDKMQRHRLALSRHSHGLSKVRVGGRCFTEANEGNEDGKETVDD